MRAGPSRRVALAALAVAAGLAGWVAAQTPSPAGASAPPAAFRAALATKAPLLGLARAGKRLVAVGDWGVVVLSDDDGRTWRQAASVASRSMLTSVAFVDEKRGFAVGHGGTVLETNDGGEHWTRNHDAGADVVLLTIWFGSAGHGIAAGAFGFAMATHDGGRSWREFSLGEGDDRDRHLNGIFAVPGGPLYIAAEAGTVFRSSDGGATWATLRLPYDGSLWGGMPLRDGSVLVWGMRGHVLRSADQGKGWIDVPTGTNQSWTGGLQLADGTVVLVGLGGAVATSADGGRTFRTTIRPDRQTLSAVTVGTPGQLVIAGMTGIATLALAAP